MLLVGVGVGILVTAVTGNPVLGVAAGFATGTAISHWGEGNDWGQSVADGCQAGISAGELAPIAIPFFGFISGMGSSSGSGGGSSSTSMGGQTNSGNGMSLYRVVDPVERADIEATGSFNPSPGGGIGKYFWGNQQDAEKYIGILPKSWNPNPSIVKTGIDDPSLIDGPNIMDGMPGYVVPNDQLGKLWPPEFL
ncbi:MAG TPA: hypothetical protein VKU00_31720 [Chthonomonadaceae bacterium]|nr:hypothetical protein [Chthonomonadaceae bacterium]